MYRTSYLSPLGYQSTRYSFTVLYSTGVQNQLSLTCGVPERHGLPDHPAEGGADLEAGDEDPGGDGQGGRQDGEEECAGHSGQYFAEKKNQQEKKGLKR